MTQKLVVTDHSRDIVGLQYVYPVLSRRAGGLSIGINFNTNNACNWRCVYCQVPGLIKGAAPGMDFKKLEQELRFFINKVLNGDFFDQFDVPEHMRVIKDIAISGNGEPTSLREFPRAINLIGRVLIETGVLPLSEFVLITNGSLVHQQYVQTGLRSFRQFQGKVWFKLDSAIEESRKKINGNRQTNENMLKNLEIASALCETQIQTCLLTFLPNAEEEEQAYLDLLFEIQNKQYAIEKIMLYTMARESLQPEASQLRKAEEMVMMRYAQKITELGYQVSVAL